MCMFRKQKEGLLLRQILVSLKSSQSSSCLKWHRIKASLTNFSKTEMVKWAQTQEHNFRNERERAISPCDTLGLVPELCKSLLLNTKRSLWERRKSSNYICTLFLLLKQCTKDVGGNSTWLTNCQARTGKRQNRVKLFPVCLFSLWNHNVDSENMFFKWHINYQNSELWAGFFSGQKKIVAH